MFYTYRIILILISSIMSQSHSQHLTIGNER